MTNLSLSPLKINLKWSNIIQHLLLLVHLKGTSRDCIYRKLGLESLAEQRWSCKIFFFHKIIMVSYQHIYSHILATVTKEFIESKEPLREGKYFSHSFFLIVLNSGKILVRSFGKLNQQFNLKQKFSNLSDQKKPQFLKFVT